MQTIIEWLTAIVGEYTPNVYTVDADVSIIASGAAGVDWVWVAAAAMLLLGVWAGFRLIGVFLGGICK